MSFLEQPDTDELLFRYNLLSMQHAEQIRRNAQKDEVIGRQQERIHGLESDYAKAKQQVEWYEEQHRLALLRQFGTSREHTPAGQERLFNEAEVAADPAAPEPELEPEPEVKAGALSSAEQEAVKPAATSRKTGKKVKDHRKKQLANLRIVEVEHPLEGPMVCECCRQPMEFAMWESTDKLCAIPATIYREIHKQPVYTCKSCHAEGMPAPIRMAHTMPPQAFPASLASSSAVAYIIVEKFVMGTPYYRQEHNVEALADCGLSRQTMANWSIKASDVLTPIFNRMHEILVGLDVLYADETKLQVLHEPGRAATTDSTMWMYRSGPYDPRIVLFEYQPTRAGKHAENFLAGFGGYDPVAKQIVKRKYLHVDGYNGYSAVPRQIIVGSTKVPDVILSGCWSHARRGFQKADSLVKPEDRKSGKQVVAEQGLKLCNELFEIESQLKDMSPEQRLAQRQERSLPLINRIKGWLDEQSIKVLPKSATGEAITYCLNQWSKLTAFLQDGRVEIDNNRSERSIKPFVIGRKNWLFANTPNGATASAILYSIVETAKENGLIPFEYLKFLFEQLPAIDTNNKAALDELLPWSQTIPDYCRKPVKRSQEPTL